VSGLGFNASLRNAGEIDIGKLGSRPTPKATPKNTPERPTMGVMVVPTPKTTPTPKATPRDFEMGKVYVSPPKRSPQKSEKDLAVAIEKVKAQEN
jgi:hypothetical protein